MGEMRWTGEWNLGSENDVRVGHDAQVGVADARVGPALNGIVSYRTFPPTFEPGYFAALSARV